jgi:hypothetical protein
MEKILIYKAKSINDFFFLRKVRNLNLRFFTENNKYLSYRNLSVVVVVIMVALAVAVVVALSVLW